MTSYSAGSGDLQLWLADPSAPPADPATDVVLVHADAETLVPPLGPAEGLEGRLTLVEQFALDPSGDRGHRDLAPRRATYRIVLCRRARFGRTRCREVDVGSARPRCLAADEPNVAMLDLQLLLEDAGPSAGQRHLLVPRAYPVLEARLRAAPDRSSSICWRVCATDCGRCSVLDLDNTLWGGVIGDDGIGGIALGEDGVG